MGTRFINLSTLPLSCTASDILPISQVVNSVRNTYQVSLQQIKSFVLDGVNTSTSTSNTTLNISALESVSAVNGNTIIYDSTSNKFRLSSNYRVKTIFNDTLLGVSDCGYIVKVNSTNRVEVSIPANASQPIPIGTQIILVQENTGVIQIDVETNAVTLDSTIDNAGYALATRERYSVVNLIKTDTNRWSVYGDLTVYPDSAIIDSKYEIYDIDQGYKIKLVFIKTTSDPTWRDDVKDVVISAANKWSNILKNTKFPKYKVPGIMLTFSGNSLETLPNIFQDEYFDGLILTVGQENWTSVESLSDSLGYASTFFNRVASGSKYNRIPVIGSFMLNTGKYSTALNPATDLGVPQLYYTALHELGHTLGLGTEWYRLNYGVGNNIFRSFIVGAGDTSTTNPHGSTGNIFYTIDRGDGSRTAASRGTLLVDGQNLGDTTYTFAYNPNTSVGNSSKDVYYYNQTFSTNVTAIPLESVKGEGSYGSHWYEGDPDYNTYGILTGYDNRTYYGNLTGGAYAMRSELMSPNLEFYADIPLSKVTLGALEDLGYVVDYNQADLYTPNQIKIKLEVGVAIYIKPNNFGGWFRTSWYETPSTYLYAILPSLRKGLTYTILNENSDAFKVFRAAGGPNGTQTLLASGTTSATFQVPSSYSYTDVILIRFDGDAGVRVVYRIGG